MDFLWRSHFFVGQKNICRCEISYRELIPIRSSHSIKLLNVIELKNNLTYNLHYAKN